MSIDALPSGWVATTINDLVEINPRGWEAEPRDDEAVSFVPMAAVEAGTGKMNAFGERPWGEVKRGYTTFQDGDVLFAKITPCMENGKMALAWGLWGGRGAGSTEYHVLRPSSAVHPKLLLYFLLQKSFRGEARTKMKGAAGQLRVPREFLARATLLLPPIAEQHRIVAAIEQQLTRLDAAVAALERARANLKRYRAAVLAEACAGRLVPIEAELARAEGRHYETADQFLAQITAARPTRREMKDCDSTRSGFATTPPLPVGWAWTSLQVLKAFSLYGPRFSSSDYTLSGQLVLRTSDISEAGKVNLTTAPKLSLKAEEFAKYKVERGDLLITRTGSLGTLAVFNDTVDAIPGAYLIHYRLVAPQITSWYVFYVLKSPTGQRQLLKGGAGVGRPNLNAPTIEAIPIPLPPLAEQYRIVAEIERRLSVVDELDATVVANLKRAERMRQAILQRAFEGKLVPQDPSDEPAGALLERIRVELDRPDAGRPRRALRQARHRQGHRTITTMLPLFESGTDEDP